MTRREKYPETKTFSYYNANPHNRLTTDCVARAICTATNNYYNVVVGELAKMQQATGYAANSAEGYGRYLEIVCGFKKQKQPRKQDGTKYTGSEFCTWLSVNDPDGKIGKIVANIGGGHVVCIAPTNSGDGINCRYKVLDTWDSTDGSIGNWWRK